MLSLRNVLLCLCSSGKVLMLKQLIEESKAKGKRMLVFSMVSPFAVLCSNVLFELAKRLTRIFVLGRFSSSLKCLTF